MKTARKTSVITAILLFVLLIAVIPAPRAQAAEASVECGKDGDNLIWSFSGGTLTITGAGEMADYGEEDVPWADLRDGIEKILLPDGVTSIGNNAFSLCGE